VATSGALGTSILQAETFKNQNQRDAITDVTGIFCHKVFLSCTRLKKFHYITVHFLFIFWDVLPRGH
jgi:hypothetical protein